VEKKEFFFLGKHFRIFLHTMDFKRNQHAEVQINAVSKSYEVLQINIYLLFNHNCLSCAGLRRARDYVITLETSRVTSIHRVTSSI